MTISAELEAEAKEIAEQITREAIAYFERAIERAGIVLSGDLKNSFDYEIIQTAGRLSVAGVIEFRGYGRFKDMKVLTYAGMPPIEAMMDFVEKVGVDKFAYVPGYSARQISDINNAAKRIAWAVAMYRKRIPTVRRPSRAAWYNKTKADMMNVLRRRMLDRAQGAVLKAMKEAAT